MYLHVDASSEAGTLPTTEQSTKTANFNFDAQTTNRSMDTTIGSAQTSVSHTLTTAFNNNTLSFVTKFISPELDQTSVSANTWRYNFSTKHNNLTPCEDYPTPDNAHTVPICVYVWRPGDGTKVGNILDGNTANVYTDTGSFQDPPGTTSQVAQDGTFTGSAVASVQTGDVIVLEAWISVYTDTAASLTLQYLFDGAIETLTNGSVVSNHASFLETPENLTFVTSPGTTGPLRPYHSYTETGFWSAVGARTF
jgi:hypothetical protein